MVIGNQNGQIVLVKIGVRLPVAGNLRTSTSKMHAGKYRYSDSDFQCRHSESERLVGGDRYGSRFSAPMEPFHKILR